MLCADCKFQSVKRCALVNRLATLCHGDRNGASGFIALAACAPTREQVDVCNDSAIRSLFAVNDAERRIHAVDKLLNDAADRKRTHIERSVTRLQFVYKIFDVDKSCLFTELNADSADVCADVCSLVVKSHFKGRRFKSVVKVDRNRDIAKRRVSCRSEIDVKHIEDTLNERRVEVDTDARFFQKKFTGNNAHIDCARGLRFSFVGGFGIA